MQKDDNKYVEMFILETLKEETNYVISGLLHGVNKILDLLRCYAALIGSYLWTFRDISFPSSRVKMGPIGYPKT
jgi:hypothetical protein